MERPGRKYLLTIVWISLVFVVMLPCSSLILFIWVISFFFISPKNHLLDSLIVCIISCVSYSMMSCLVFSISCSYRILVWFVLVSWNFPVASLLFIVLFLIFSVVLIPVNFPLIVVHRCHSWVGQLVAPLFWKLALYLPVPWEPVLKKEAFRPIPVHGIVNITIMLN